MSNGRLRVSLLSGQNLSLNSSEKYFVTASFPDGLCKTTSLKTDSLTKEQFENWNTSAILDLLQPVSGQHQIRLVLMEFGRLKDKAVGGAVFECAELFQGNPHVVSTLSLSAAPGTPPLCNITIDFGWEGDVPGYIPTGFGGATAAGVASPATVTATPSGGNTAVAAVGQAASLPACDGRTYSVRVLIRKAKNLQSDSDNKIYDPLVNVSIGNETQKTSVQKATNEPFFDEELMFQVKADAMFWSLPINVNVMHHRLGFPDDDIGMTQLEMQSVYRCPQHVMAHKWFLLRRGGMSTQIMGFLKMSIMVLDALNDSIPEIDDDPEDGEESEDALILNLVNTPGAQFEEVYLRCDMLRAEGIPQMDGITSGGKADPFVKVAYGLKSNRTSHLNNTLTPQWNAAFMVPIQKPALLDCLSVQLYDYDGVGKDKLIGTARLSVDNMKALPSETVPKSEEGLPRQYAQFINFYGCPRNYYKDNLITFSAAKPKYYHDMDKGLKEPVDFRGRLLCRFAGSRDRECAKDPLPFKPKTAFLHFSVAVQALTFSMLKGGTYTFQISCGNGEDKPPAASRVPKVAEGMKGSASGDLFSVYFGEEIRLDQKLEIVLPPSTEDSNAFREFVLKQIPDVFFHLYQDKSLYAVYRVKATGIMWKEGFGAYLVCDTLRVLADPEKNKEGVPPSDPLGQFYMGMTMHKLEATLPTEAPVTPEEVAILPLGKEPRFPGISSDAPMKYRCEVCVYRGVDFPVGDPNGLSDPYVRVCWANSTAQTGAQLETLNPTYDELLVVNAETRQPFTNIVVELWDWDLIGSNTFLARAVVAADLGTADATAGVPTWLQSFTDHRGKPIPEAKLLVSFEMIKVVGATAPTYAKRQFQKKPGRSETYTGYDLPNDKKLKLLPHRVTLSALALRKMRPFRMLDVKNSQVIMSLGNTVVEFEKQPGLNPDVNQSKTFVVDLPKNAGYWPNLSVSVYDNRALGSKPRVGVATVNLTQLGKDENGQPCMVNRFLPSNKDASRKATEAALKKRLEAILRWKKETFGDPLAFGDAVTAAASDVYSPMETYSEAAPGTDDLSAGLVTAAAPAAPPRRNSEKKTKKKGQRDRMMSGRLDDEDDGDNAEATDEDDDEAEKAISSFKEKQAKQFVDKELDGKTEEDPKATAETAADIAWFERFDADESIVNKDFIVSRLGKVHDYLSKNGKAFQDVREGTAEAYFGPFADDTVVVGLNRGQGKGSSKAGEIKMDLIIEPVDVTKAAVATAPATDATLKADHIKDRLRVPFELRAYLIACRHLAAVDHSMSGSSSDPYIVLTLSSGAESGVSKNDKVKINLKEFRKDKTLNPDYYLVQQLQGELPKHSTLLVEVFDYNDILPDKLIGFTTINLEDRWHSCRGYKTKPAYMEPGSYTEKRLLRDENGQIQGSIELWLDMFPQRSSIPHPIDITPPPPLELELRTIVWQTRDVMLEDISMSGEAMVDIYVRAWMNGMRHDMQSTDVHYRSLDGSGTFNWRMNFQFMLDPRSRKIMPMGKKAKTIANWFRIRREQRKFDPVLKVQIFDNNLLPGMDNFIGEASLNLLKLRPVTDPRSKTGLLMEMLSDMKEVATTFLVCKCCRRQPTLKDLPLEQRQQLAVAEFEADMKLREERFKSEAKERRMQLEALKQYTDAQLDVFEKKFLAEARARSQVNALEAYLPSAKKRKSDATASKYLKSVKELPPVTETAKFWFTTRGPKGSSRVGDVQMSFQLVRLDALEKDEKLAAGRGRAEPQALPDPNRPDSSYFWLTSPFKAATHILWTRYKWYLLALIVLILLGLFIYVFLTTGVEEKAKHFFD